MKNRTKCFCSYCKIILIFIIPVITGRSAVDILALGLGLSRSLDLDLLYDRLCLSRSRSRSLSLSLDFTLSRSADLPWNCHYVNFYRIQK